MKDMLSLISNYYPITGNPITDTALYLVIGMISFPIAFKSTGKIFDAIGLHNSDLMSLIHWTLRIGIFIGTAWILRKIIQLVSFIISFDWWVYLIVSILLVIIYFLHYHQRLRGK